MPTLADVVRQHGPGYESRFGAALLPSHARALRDILGCRTPLMGAHLMECQSCGTCHLVYHSCRNRACAGCGAERAADWVERQRELLLPAAYFHVVFTVPAELRELVRGHQKKLIPVLFQAAFQSLAALSADTRHLGGKIGALAVLHTWTRTLQWHPHVHLLVPGGALSSDGTWVPAKRRRRKPREPYLVPVQALSVKFWGRFLALARKALPGDVFPDMPRKQK
jgi:Transposase zinc-binding domain/Putative transposase